MDRDFWIILLPSDHVLTLRKFLSIPEKLNSLKLMYPKAPEQSLWWLMVQIEGMER